MEDTKKLAEKYTTASGEEFFGIHVNDFDKLDKYIKQCEQRAVERARSKIEKEAYKKGFKDGQTNRDLQRRMQDIEEKIRKLEAQLKNMKEDGTTRRYGGGSSYL